MYSGKPSDSGLP